MRFAVEWADESFRALKKCAVLGNYVKRHGPPVLKIYKDRFYALTFIVVSQQLSGKAADSIFSRLKERVGKIEPRSISSVDDGVLRGIGLSGAKTRTLKAVSSAVSDGMDLQAMDKLEDDEIRARLCEIKGIGPWTAEMFLMFALGRPDVVSVGDLGLRKGLAAVYGLESVPEPKMSGELFERWRPWRTAASWYLWRIVGGDEPAW